MTSINILFSWSEFWTYIRQNNIQKLSFSSVFQTLNSFSSTLEHSSATNIKKEIVEREIPNH